MPNCTQGNKPCGKRCIPESYNCGAADADANLGTVQTRGEQRFGTRLLNTGGKQRATQSSAKRRMDQMEKEAIELAGGSKKAYEKDLEKVIRDSGAGIKARIVRTTMRRLAPSLVKADDLNLYLTVKKRGHYEEQVYRKDRTKFRQSDIIRKGDRLKPGDILRVRMGAGDATVGGGFGYHYGVYMGNGRVVQYGNQYIDPKTGKQIKQAHIEINETNLKNLNKKGGIKWEKVSGLKTKYTPEQLEARIAKVKGMKVRYNMISNNCEHFAYLLTHDKAYSSQSDISSGSVGGIVKTLFHYVQLQRRRADKKSHMEFKHLDAVRFSEKQLGKKFKKSMRLKSKLDDDFIFPNGLIDIEKALTKAMKFAESTAAGDENQQTGILAGWLKEYIDNVTNAIVTQ